MENLLKILTDPSKRLPMATLLKCEQVLDSLEMAKPPGVGSVPSATTTITSTPMHMCQPLLDAVATNMKSPMFNHALQQTFGPAMTALFGAPIRAPSPPPKRGREKRWRKMKIFLTSCRERLLGSAADSVLIWTQRSTPNLKMSILSVK